MLVEVELYQIVITECSPTQVVVLKETDGERCFPIYIHYNEAMAIDRKLKDITVPRPLTHDLLKSVIEGMGGTLEKVLINDLSESTYFAKLVIKGPAVTPGYWNDFERTLAAKREGWLCTGIRVKRSCMFI